MSRFNSKVLQKLLRKNAPERIPRDFRRAKEVDCYALYMEMGPGVSLAVTGTSEFGIIGNYWAGQDFHIEICVPYKWINLKDFNIHYFWKHFEFRYRSIWSCLLLGETGLDRLRARLSAFGQFLYNRKPLIRRGRIEILRLLVERSLQEQNFRFSAISLMTTLHTERWALHPDKNRQIRYLNLMLDSLVASGAVEKCSRESSLYTVKGKALNEIINYEEDERRHRDNVTHNRAVRFLTIVLILVGIAQAWIQTTGK